MTIEKLKKLRALITNPEDFEIPMLAEIDYLLDAGLILEDPISTEILLTMVGNRIKDKQIENLQLQSNSIEKQFDTFLEMCNTNHNVITDFLFTLKQTQGVIDLAKMAGNWTKKEAVQLGGIVFVINNEK